MKLGVIDLGTNTFHLLIVEVFENDSFKELYRERLYVQLADEGIHTIGSEAYKRATDAMVHYAAILAEYEVSKVKSFATAALRRASNGSQFVKEIKEQTGLQIELISGDREAQLIACGVKKAVPMSDNVDLIMDIGGGSVEFILANNTEVFWAKSFQIGVAVLFNDFHHSDPMKREEIANLYAHLKATLAPLLAAIKERPAVRLIGASGTFDVLETILTEGKSGPYYAEFPSVLFHDLYQKIVPATLAERLSFDDIPEKRAKLITVAMCLLDFVIREIGINLIAVSSFAMKEGILSEMAIGKSIVESP